MTAVAYVLIALFSAGQSVFAKYYDRAGGEKRLFNVRKMLCGFLLFLAVYLIEDPVFHLPTLFYGLIYGALFTMALHCGYSALQEGPMSLTSSVAAFYVAIPVIYGFVFLSEAVTAGKIAGLLLLPVCIILISKKDGGSASAGFSKKWVFYVTATMLCNGFCQILQKHHQLAYPGAYVAFFTFVSMAAPFLFFALKTAAGRGATKKNVKNGRIFGYLAGACCSLASYGTLKLAGTENASVLFPIVSVGTILSAVLFGRVLFKEKLSAFQIAAIGIGIAAVLLLKLA